MKSRKIIIIITMIFVITTIFNGCTEKNRTAARCDYRI